MTIALHDVGTDVVVLQNSLTAAGFPCGRADGNFGDRTEAAVLSFQHCWGLLADGIVGSRTAVALQLPAGMVPPATMPNLTVDIVCQMFPQTPRAPIEENLPLVLGALEKADLTSAQIVLCAVSTIRAENPGWIWLDEFISKYNTSPGGHPFDLYDHRKDLGNTAAPDGASFKGRGPVQLTGKANYAKFGPKLGLDLVNEPELANTPENGAKLLAEFILADEIPMKTALLHGELSTARRLVNGGTLGLEVFTEAYNTGARLLGLAA
jgi:putative chitinase